MPAANILNSILNKFANTQIPCQYKTNLDRLVFWALHTKNTGVLIASLNIIYEEQYRTHCLTQESTRLPTHDHLFELADCLLKFNRLKNGNTLQSVAAQFTPNASSLEHSMQIKAVDKQGSELALRDRAFNFFSEQYLVQYCGLTSTPQIIDAAEAIYLYDLYDNKGKLLLNKVCKAQSEGKLFVESKPGYIQPTIHEAIGIFDKNNQKLCGLIHFLYLHHLRAAKIRSIAIMPDKQKQGLGSLLMYIALCRLYAIGVIQVRLRIGIDDSLPRFYSKLGFNNYDSIDPAKYGLWLNKSTLDYIKHQVLLVDKPHKRIHRAPSLAFGLRLSTAHCAYQQAPTQTP